MNRLGVLNAEKSRAAGDNGDPSGQIKKVCLLHDGLC
jgi:hypothetical protein